MLQITWDGEAKPAVWSPLGDFFGTAPGVNLYRSFPLGMTEEGCYCNWYMPFANAAKFELVNEGTKPRTLDLEGTYEPLRRPIEQLGRFHAKWHRDAFLPEDPERRKIDWTMLKTEGRGPVLRRDAARLEPARRLVGRGRREVLRRRREVPLHHRHRLGGLLRLRLVQSRRSLRTATTTRRSATTTRATSPSTAGTSPTTSRSRQSFEAAIEKYYPNASRRSTPPRSTGIRPPDGKTPTSRCRWQSARATGVPSRSFKVKGALEGEELKILRKTGGNPAPQDMSGYEGTWSNESHLWWTDAKPGDTLDLAVPVEKAGTYKLKMQLTKAIDYGIVQLSLDGKKLGEPIDLFNRRRGRHGRSRHGHARAEPGPARAAGRDRRGQRKGRQELHVRPGLRETGGWNDYSMIRNHPRIQAGKGVDDGDDRTWRVVVCSGVRLSVGGSRPRRTRPRWPRDARAGRPRHEDWTARAFLPAGES